MKIPENISPEIAAYIKALQSENSKLQNENSEIKSKISKLQNENSELKTKVESIPSIPQRLPKAIPKC